MFGTTIISYLLEISTFYTMFLVDAETIYEWAIEYDPYLSKFFHEPSFFVIPHFLLDRVVAAHLFIIGFTMFSFIALSVFFIYQIFKNQTISTTKFQKSLILSSIMQIYLTNIFLIGPMFMFFIFITFDIPNSASAMCCLTSVIMTHCLVEFAATLYFISPYRKFITTYFRKKLFTQNTSVQHVSGFIVTPRGGYGR
uniref:Serpentine Receptor, class H n=1 Tax=Panagrolaimus davidi TaxID=227884 RepID=A0A914P763_9BILA